MTRWSGYVTASGAQWDRCEWCGSWERVTPTPIRHTCRFPAASWAYIAAALAEATTDEA